ncbi:MAG: RNA pseudouridine synthase [Bacteroidales bacterium]
MVYEDNHLLVINKKSSQIVQGDISGDAPLSDLLKAYIKQRDAKPGQVYMGVVHRLDRPVSGLVIFAKTDKALVRLNQMFKDRQIQKIYWAITRNKPPKEADTLVHWLRKNESQNKSYTYSSEQANTLRAELSYRCIASSDKYYLLEVELHTGRHHQIRAQLSAIGCPIKGDLKYGDKRSNEDASISLHARKIKFIHPVKKEEMALVAAVPEDVLWKVFER